MATERLLATSYRFEINKGGNSKRHAEELRIAALEDQNRKSVGQEKINSEVFKASWIENFNRQNEVYRLKNGNKQVTDELNILRKANIMLRRDAMQKLYSKDYEQYERELNALGLCIHKERI